MAGELDYVKAWDDWCKGHRRLERRLRLQHAAFFRSSTMLSAAALFAVPVPIEFITSCCDRRDD